MTNKRPKTKDPERRSGLWDVRSTSKPTSHLPPLTLILIECFLFSALGLDPVQASPTNLRPRSRIENVSELESALDGGDHEVIEEIEQPLHAAAEQTIKRNGGIEKEISTHAKGAGSLLKLYFTEENRGTL